MMGIRMQAANLMGRGDVLSATVSNLVSLFGANSRRCNFDSKFLTRAPAHVNWLFGRAYGGVHMSADGSISHHPADLAEAGTKFSFEPTTGHFDTNVAVEINGMNDEWRVSRSAAFAPPARYWAAPCLPYRCPDASLATLTQRIT